MGSLVSGNEPFAEQGGPIDRAVHQWRELSTVESHEKDVGRQWYTVHVKSNGPGTWTGKLCAAMEKTITDGGTCGVVEAVARQPWPCWEAGRGMVA